MGAYQEQGIVFERDDNRLIGVLSQPAQPHHLGVLILVGGPQYRVGSHRQFTSLARCLAQAGIPSLRFDYTGMGDSEGAKQPFDASADDIQCALQVLRDNVPGVTDIVLWGLCDAASASLLFAHQMPSVKGVVLLNPWVHGEEYSPAVRLSHYYRPLLVEKGYWRKVINGKVDLWPAVREFARATVSTVRGLIGSGRSESVHERFVFTMLQGLKQFQYPILVILSEGDLTAKEFTRLVASDTQWSEALARPSVTSHAIAGADHTFSSKRWKAEVEQVTLQWLGQL